MLALREVKNNHVSLRVSSENKLHINDDEIKGYDGVDFKK
jgi:hypothetical protein